MRIAEAVVGSNEATPVCRGACEGSGAMILPRSCDYFLLEVVPTSEALPPLEPRFGRRMLLTLPLLPPPQKN